jgi:hypothetical protein
MATSAARFGLPALDLHDPVCRQARPSLSNELLDAIDRPHARGNLVVVNHEHLPVALHPAPLVQLGRALRRAPTEIG